jgi:hypothetical protein
MASNLKSAKIRSICPIRVPKTINQKPKKNPKHQKLTFGILA